MSIAVYTDVEEALFATLSQDSTITALLGNDPTRIFATIAPDALVSPPYAVFNANIARELRRTPTPEIEAGYRITVYAQTRLEAHAIQGALHHRLMQADLPLLGYACYQVLWNGATSTTSADGGRIVWAVTGEYRARWVMG